MMDISTWWNYQEIRFVTGILWIIISIVFYIIILYRLIKCEMEHGEYVCEGDEYVKEN